MLAVSALLLTVSYLLLPERFPQVASTTGLYLAEVLWILPSVLILAGLLLAWFPRRLVVKYLGETSGVKGFLLSIALGMLPTGPAYLAFPIAAALLRKGARIANIVIFLSAWSCIKLPQELVELQFLGLEFMAARLLLTIMLVIPVGLAVERLASPLGKRTADVRRETPPF